MPVDLFPDGTLNLLDKVLTWRSREQEIHAGNLANLDTPNYTRQEVDFQQVLKDHLQGRPRVILATTNPEHLKGSGLEAGLVKETNDQVDLDQEMVSLSVNQLGYQASVTMLIKKLDQLRAVVEGSNQ